MGIPYESPLYCAKCSTPIRKKPRAKTPKYCPPCRQQLQADWKRQLKDSNIRKARRND